MLDPDSQSVTLVNMGGTKGKAFKLRTKIKLVNPDASILQDSSQLLDVSNSASYIVDNFHNKEQQP